MSVQLIAAEPAVARLQGSARHGSGGADVAAGLRAATAGDRPGQRLHAAGSRPGELPRFRLSRRSRRCRPSTCGSRRLLAGLPDPNAPSSSLPPVSARPRPRPRPVPRRDRAPDPPEQPAHGSADVGCDRPAVRLPVTDTHAAPGRTEPAPEPRVRGAGTHAMGAVGQPEPPGQLDDRSCEPAWRKGLGPRRHHDDRRSRPEHLLATVRDHARPGRRLPRLDRLPILESFGRSEFGSPLPPRPTSPTSTGPSRSARPGRSRPSTTTSALAEPGACSRSSSGRPPARSGSTTSRSRASRPTRLRLVPGDQRH